MKLKSRKFPKVWNSATRGRGGGRYPGGFESLAGKIYYEGETSGHPDPTHARNVEGELGGMGIFRKFTLSRRPLSYTERIRTLQRKLYLKTKEDNRREPWGEVGRKDACGKPAGTI
jgi:hypothetical protein